MRKIAYTRPDGGLSILHPVINSNEVGIVSEAQAEARAFALLPQDAINPVFIEHSAIPTDRTFRDAWKLGQETVEIDMVSAKEIQKNKLRELRAPLLASLDTDFIRALEAGDKQAQSSVTAQKQALRDVTDDPALDAATTPDQLAAVLPDALKS